MTRLILSVCGLVASSAMEGDALSEVRKELPLQTWQSQSACGPNALFCLLKVHGKEVDYDGLVAHLDPQESGNSLEELRRASALWGLPTMVVSVDRRGIRQLPVPFIAHVENYDLKHFLVVTGWRGDDVLVWDEERGGDRPYPAALFYRNWSGYALATGTGATDRLLVNLIVVLLAVAVTLAGSLALSRRASLRLPVAH